MSRRKWLRWQMGAFFLQPREQSQESGPRGAPPFGAIKFNSFTREEGAPLRGSRGRRAPPPPPAALVTAQLQLGPEEPMFI